MANNKIDRINKEIAKTREKITEYQNKLKGLEVQKTEAENLEIVQLVRAMRLTPQELNVFISPAKYFNETGSYGCIIRILAINIFPVP